MPSKRPKPKRIIWPNQFHALIAVLPQPYGTIVILAVLARLRKGELEALRWNDNRPGVLVNQRRTGFVRLAREFKSLRARHRWPAPFLGG